MTEAHDPLRVLCDLARSSGSLVQWRSDALAIVRSEVPFDGALFHELSPRVPLDRAALVGIDRSALELSRASWDELAVVLGRLRDLASAQQGVASTDEAFAAGSRGRKDWSARVAKVLRAPEALMAHLEVGGRIVAGVVLVRRAAFRELDRDRMRRLVPALAVGDALRQLADSHALQGLVAELRCVDQRLTERQRQLVELVALGQTDAEIALALGISANTVRNQLVRVRERLGAANRAEVVRAAVLR